MRFKSSVSALFLAVAIGTPLLMVASLLPVLRQGNSEAMIAGLVLLAVVALLGWMLFSTSYYVDDGRLRIACGPFRWNIALADIESVEPSRSVIASPALSLDRLRIIYSGSRSVLVSPADPERFLAAIGRIP